MDVRAVCAVWVGLLAVSLGCGGNEPADECIDSSCVRLEERTEAEVCEAWLAGHETDPTIPWEAGSDTCDPGTVSPFAIEDTVRRVSMYRWLVGLEPVVAHDNAAIVNAVQACAVIMRANMRLSHHPDPSWACYSPEGATGAAISNLALPVSHPADAIDLYATDRDVPSLGHRRWMLNGHLRRVAVGSAGTANCLGVHDTTGRITREWTAYPNPGPAPVETVLGVWSLHSNSLRVATASVTVHRVEDEAELPVRAGPLAGAYGPGAVSIEPDGWRPSVTESYRVTATLGDGTSIEYVINPVNCTLGTSP